ncbi:MAG: response regulator [Sandaracinaceae bacterium]
MDDDPELLGSLGRLLEGEGYQPRTFACPRSALAALLVDPPEVVVTDHWMPSLTGGQLARYLRHRLGARAPSMIALTGRYGSVPEEDALAFDVMLEKPCDPQVLLWRVARELEQVDVQETGRRVSRSDVRLKAFREEEVEAARVDDLGPQAG